MRFFSEIYRPFCFVLPGSKSSLVYIIFRTPMQLLMVRSPTSPLHVDSPPSCMPHTQLMRHFCLGTTYVLFTSGNRCTSFYTTQATYAAFAQGNNLYPVNFRKQLHFLLCRPCNLYDVKENFQSISNAMIKVSISLICMFFEFLELLDPHNLQCYNCSLSFLEHLEYLLCMFI